MKYRKIFTFILLLCTIFSTLLVINPNVKAQTVADLTNTTWTFPTSDGYILRDNSLSRFFGNYSVSYNTLNSDNTISYYTSFNITGDVSSIQTSRYLFVNNGDNFTMFGGYGDGALYSRINSITFVGGADSTNSLLIEFMQTFATIEETPEPEPDPVYTISGQYQFNEEITWLYDTSEQEGILYLPFYVYNLDNSMRVDYDYMLNKNDTDLGINYFFYANETNDGIFTGQYAGTFTTSTNIRMFGDERIIYFYTAEVSEEVYTWLNDNGQFINDPTLDPNNPENPDSGNNPNNPNNPDFGTDTVRQIVNQVNAFLGIQIFPGLSFRDILLICIALPLLMYILKVFLGG